MLFQNLKKTKPPRIIELPEGMFREGSESPLPGTRVGLRRLSVMELQYCRDEAKMYESEGQGSYENAMAVNVVAQSLTFPEDVTKPLLKAGDLEARCIFTPQGIQFLYDVVLQLHVTTTGVYDEISDENLEKVIKLLKTVKLSKKVKRLLSYLLDELCQ
jgi:hypothetical protein